MSWVSQKVQNDFSFLVSGLVSFCQKYGYGHVKYKNEFAGIAYACYAIQLALENPRRPNGVDATIAGLLNIIETQLKEIIAKKLKKTTDFVNDEQLVFKLQNEFSATFKNFLKESEKDKAEAEEKELSLDTFSEDQENISFTFLKSDKLKQEIKKLEELPTQDKSLFGFFKHTVGHAWNYHPKKMIGGLTTICFSLNFATLHAYEENLAPILDQFMQDIGMNFSSEYAIAAMLLVVGSGLIANSLRQSRPEKNEVKKENSPLMISDAPPPINENDEGLPLLEYRNTSPSKRFGCC